MQAAGPLYALHKYLLNFIKANVVPESDHSPFYNRHIMPRNLFTHLRPEHVLRYI